MYMYTNTYFGFMHAYYVHIANIHPCMSDTHTNTKIHRNHIYT